MDHVMLGLRLGGALTYGTPHGRIFYLDCVCGLGGGMRSTECHSILSFQFVCLRGPNPRGPVADAPPVLWYYNPALDAADSSVRCTTFCTRMVQQ